MSRSLLIFTVIALLVYNCCVAQGTRIDLITPPKDEPWKLIRGAAQDPQGFLWLATDRGLYRYDGYKCVPYHNESSNSNSLAGNWLECIYGGKEDFLLIGTFGSGLDRLDLSTNNFTHYRYNSRDRESLSNDTVTAIIKDKQGFFWIATHNGLNRFDARTGKFTRYMNDPNDTSSLSDNQVRTLFEDRTGTIWIGTKSPWVHDGGARVGGLNRFVPEKGKFIRYVHNPADLQSLVTDEITAIFEDSHGTFWVGTSGNVLHIMNRDKGTFERHLFDPIHPEKLMRPVVINGPRVNDFITFIKEDANGKIWIGTIVNGINVYDPVTRQTVHYGSGKNSKEKLADDGFSTAFTSRDGIFWIASWGTNLYRINPYEIALPYNPVGKAVSNFYEDSSGILWMTTTQGLLRKDKNGSLRQFVIDKEVSSKNNFMRTIGEDREHNLWIGTAYNGLYRFNPKTGTFTGYHHKPGDESSLICDTINTILNAGNNKLWVGTFSGLDLMDMASGVFTHYARDPKDFKSFEGGDFSDQGNASVSDIAISRDHTVWVCVGGDINRLNEQTRQFKKYPLDNEYVYCVLEDSRGNIWLGTTAGLFRYNKRSDNFTHFYDSSGIINRNITVSRMLEDRQKNLWLKTFTGLIKLNVEKSEASVYENKEHNYSWVILKSYLTTSGEILSGDTSGYFAFYPENLLKNALPPAIIMTNFFLKDELVKPGTGLLHEPLTQTKEIRLKHNQNMFSFEFTSIDLTSAGEDGHILYRLVNYDSKWHKADAERIASYSNIPTGRYVFELKAMSKKGIWVQKELRVVVMPPWWRTWWAYTIFALSFIGAVWLFIYYRSQQLRRENRILEKKVTMRTHELQDEKDKVETTLTELKAAQTQLIQSEKMASLGELTAGIAHEIQNPLNFVNNFSEVSTELIDELKEQIRDGDKEEAIAIADGVKDNLQKVIHHGQRADAIVKSMLQHSRASARKKEPTDLNALAYEYLRISYHGFRAKDKILNSAPETNFDQSIGEINIVRQDIGRVLLNLYNNALYALTEKKKQQPEGYEPTVIVSTRKINDKIEIRVKDNGNGIPEKVIDKIFQPFFTTKPTGQGTGLGLSLSYDIIKTHGGEIKVESKAGEGTEFIVQLPIL